MIEYPKDLEDFDEKYYDLKIMSPTYEINIDLKCSNSFWDIFIQRVLNIEESLGLINLASIKGSQLDKVNFKRIFLPEYGHINRIE